jgi:hypothetical protein
VSDEKTAGQPEPAVPAGAAESTPATPAAAADRRAGGPPGWLRSRFWRTPGGIATVVLLALVVLLAVVELSDGTDDGDRSTDPAAHLAAGAANGRTVAAFDLLSGATSVTVQATDTGGDLYRISTPVGSHQLPQVVDSGGRVELQLVEAGGGSGLSHVDVQLNRNVRWAVRLAGGAAEDLLDLSTGQVSEVDIVAGVTHIDLSLPAPRGTVPVRLAGGATDFSVKIPAGAARKATVGGGAGSVMFNGVAHNGVSAGQVFDTPGWVAATDRYDLQLSSGVSVLTVADRG